MTPTQRRVHELETELALVRRQLRATMKANSRLAAALYGNTNTPPPPPHVLTGPGDPEAIAELLAAMSPRRRGSHVAA